MADGLAEGGTADRNGAIPAASPAEQPTREFLLQTCCRLHDG